MGHLCFSIIAIFNAGQYTYVKHHETCWFSINYKDQFRTLSSHICLCNIPSPKLHTDRDALPSTSYAQCQNQRFFCLASQHTTRHSQAMSSCCRLRHERPTPSQRSKLARPSGQCRPVTWLHHRFHSQTQRKSEAERFDPGCTILTFKVCIKQPMLGTSAECFTMWSLHNNVSCSHLTVSTCPNIFTNPTCLAMRHNQLVFLLASNKRLRFLGGNVNRALISDPVWSLPTFLDFIMFHPSHQGAQITGTWSG